VIPDSFVVIRVVCSFTVSHCFIEEDIGVYLCSISLFYLRGYWCLSLQYLIVLFKRVFVFIFAVSHCFIEEGIGVYLCFQNYI
jgi:hypothetical protein